MTDQRHCLRGIYAAAAVLRVEARDSLLVPAGPGTPLRVDAALIPLFEKCDSFNTSSGHASKIWRALSWREKASYWYPIAQTYSHVEPSVTVGPGGATEMLQAIFERGLSHGIFFALPSTADLLPLDGELPGKIETVAFVSKERPASLAKSVESYAIHNQQWGRQVNYQVLDATEAEHTVEEYKSQLALIARSTGSTILYCGLKEKRAWRKQITKAGVPEKLIDFAIWTQAGDAPAYGANRNSVLLANVDRKVLCADDDTYCVPQRPPFCEQALRLGVPKNGSRLRNMQFHDLQKAITYGHDLQLDVLAQHESVLGRSPLSLLANLPTGEAAESTSATIAMALRVAMTRGTGRVGCSFNGIAGDSGSESPHCSLFASDEDREHLLLSNAQYAGLISSRAVCRASERLLIEPAFSSCMTTVFGVANFAEIPPFFPLYRNEDSLFASVISRTSPTTCFAHLPWTLQHLPERRRAVSSLPPSQGFGFYPSTVIEHAIASFSQPAGGLDAGAALRVLGSYLLELSRAPSREFENIVLLSWRRMLTTMLASGTTMLEQYGHKPRYWAEDVQKFGAKLSAILESQCTLVPEGFEEYPHEKTIACFQDLVGRYGDLLLEWHNVRKLATEIPLMDFAIRI